MTIDLVSGPPVYRVTVSASGLVRLELPDTINQQEYTYRLTVEEIALVRRLGRIVHLNLADLIDIALAVFCADRIIPSKMESRKWRSGVRPSIHVRMALREPGRWDNANLLTKLQDVLWNFTHIQWTFEFEQKPEESRRAAELQDTFSWASDSQPRVSLFSGGLDSIAGFLVEHLSDPEKETLLLSVTTSLRKQSLRSELLQEMKQIDSLAGTIFQVDVPLNINIVGSSPGNFEQAARTRGFLFLSIAAVAAIQAGVNDVDVYESGVGAINLPYHHGQIGRDNTWATHPVALARMSEFITMVTDKPFKFRLPFLYHTKGEMCSLVPHALMGRLATLTVSCDAFPQRIAGKPLCGRCTSCVFRRLSLHAANLDALDWAERSKYVYDILDPNENLRDLGMQPLWEMLGQVEDLRRALGDPHSWSSLRREYADIEDIVIQLARDGQDKTLVTEALLRLYREYVREWDKLLDKIPLAHSRGRR